MSRTIYCKLLLLVGCLSLNAQALDREDIYPGSRLATAGVRRFAQSYSEIVAKLDAVLARNEKLPIKGLSLRSETLGKLYSLFSGYVSVRYSDVLMSDQKHKHTGSLNYFQIMAAPLQRFDLQPPKRRDLFRINPESGEVESTIHTERLFGAGEVVFIDPVAGSPQRARLDVTGEVLGLLAQVRELQTLWFQNKSLIVMREDREDLAAVQSLLEQLIVDLKLI